MQSCARFCSPVVLTMSAAHECYDDATKFLGNWGPFQSRIMLLLCASVIHCGLCAFTIVFLSDTPAHHCVISSKANISAEWRNNSIPLEEDNGIQRYSRCTRYKLDVIQRLSDNGSVPGVDVNLTEINQESCDDGWEYDRGIYVSTIVTEWDLVCGDSWKVPVTTSVMNLGVLCGIFLSGQLSDRFGRKILMFGTIAVKIAFIVFQIFSPSWLMFTALIFIVGTGNISNYLVTFVLGAEILSPSARIIYSSVGVSMCFSLGFMLNPLLAFFIRDWRMLLAAIIVPGIFYIPLWWLIPESPRWLLTKGRVEEAEAILRDAAKRNGVRAPEVIFQPLQVEDQMKGREHYNICDLVKSNNLLWITTILCFVWMVTNCGYYSLSLNTSNLHGDPFLNFFWSGAVEIPANIVSWPLMRSCSRRLCLFAALFFCGVILLFTQLIPEGLSAVSVALEMMGKFETAVAFTLVYVYAAEVYPTVLRNTAVGSCCTVSCVGSIIAPYFVYLGSYNRSLPYILIGGLCILGGLLSLLLPETHGISLPDEIDQMQTMRWCKKRQKSKHLSSNSEEVENVIAV